MRLLTEQEIAGMDADSLREYALCLTKRYKIYAYTDNLTKLRKKKFLLDGLRREIYEMRRHNGSRRVSYIMIDIDDFKGINDTYGHVVGDFVLKQLGRAIRMSIREIDIGGRYGGDEFSVVLPYTDKKEAAKVAQRIKENFNARIERYRDGARLERLRKLGIKDIPDVGLSIGIQDGTGEKNPLDIIKEADEAAYRSKRNGKNSIHVY